MKTRSEKALLQDGAVWVREQRELLGWSPAKLAIRARLMQRCQGGAGPAPKKSDIVAFEAGELRQLPRWLTLIEDVFAFEAVPPEHRGAWVDRRNWRYAGHPVDLSEVLVFRDEAMLLDILLRMGETDRRAWRAMLDRWPMRGGNERDRVEAAREWLRRMDVAMEALNADENLLLRRYRALPAKKRAEMNEAMENQFPWPPPPPVELDLEEMDLIHGYLSADADGRLMLHSMATNPKLLAGVINLVREHFEPPEPT